MTHSAPFLCLTMGRYEDLMERMPRAEAAEIEAMVAAEAKKLCPGVLCQVITVRYTRCQKWVHLLFSLMTRLCTVSGRVWERAGQCTACTCCAAVTSARRTRRGALCQNQRFSRPSRAAGYSIGGIDKKRPGKSCVLYLPRSSLFRFLRGNGTHIIQKMLSCVAQHPCIGIYIL